jgi:uncharacterized OB-fold protein
MGVSTPVLGFYDIPMWDAMNQGKFQLQACDDCGTWRYPPGPTCDKCLSSGYHWHDIGGEGVILSWVIFHRTYFDDFPAPYNAVAVRLDEGPIVITNLRGVAPQGSWIDHRVQFVIGEHGGRHQHHVVLAGALS